MREVIPLWDRTLRPGFQRAELRLDANRSAVERVEGALDRHRDAREGRRVALRVGRGLGGSQPRHEVEEARRLVALEGDDELLVVQPERVGRVEVDARV